MSDDPDDRSDGISMTNIRGETPTEAFRTAVVEALAPLLRARVQGWDISEDLIRERLQRELEGRGFEGDWRTDSEDPSEREWWAKKGEVLQRKKDGEVFHVTARLVDVDGGDRRYELWDDTHTSKNILYEIDVKDDFKRTDVVLLGGRKPKHRLDGRLYRGDDSDAE